MVSIQGSLSLLDLGWGHLCFVWQQHQGLQQICRLGPESCTACRPLSLMVADSSNRGWGVGLQFSFAHINHPHISSYQPRCPSAGLVSSHQELRWLRSGKTTRWKILMSSVWLWNFFFLILWLVFLSSEVLRKPIKLPSSISTSLL